MHEGVERLVSHLVEFDVVIDPVFLFPSLGPSICQCGCPVQVRENKENFVQVLLKVRSRSREEDGYLPLKPFPVVTFEEIRLSYVHLRTLCMWVNWCCRYRGICQDCLLEVRCQIQYQLVVLFLIQDGVMLGIHGSV